MVLRLRPRMLDAGAEKHYLGSSGRFVVLVLS